MITDTENLVVTLTKNVLSAAELKENKAWTIKT